MFPFRLPFLSFSLASTPNSRMDFPFGGKYRPEEELAIGGCGSYLPSFLFCFLEILWNLPGQGPSFMEYIQWQ